MFIERIELKNFRNYSYLNMSFDNGTNILYGDNAQGKTNVLEAIYMCSTTRSHRGAKKNELVKMDFSESDKEEKDAHIKLFFKKKYTDNRIDIHIRKNGKTGIAIDGVPIKRAAEVLGFLQVIFFSPEDLDMIRRGPAVRRQVIDIEISNINKLYFSELVNYNKIMESRNKLLKEISYSKKKSDIITLDIIDKQFEKSAIKLIDIRTKFIKEISVIIKDIHKKLSGGKEELTIIYEPNCEKENIETKLKEYREKDFRFGLTSIGPHRDDYCFMINGRDSKIFGSQGQKRTVAISFKLAEIKINEEKTGDMPVLLLDDVLSELDSKRKALLLENIKDKQTIITCTGQDEWIASGLDVKKIYEIENGTIKKQI